MALAIVAWQKLCDITLKHAAAAAVSHNVGYDVASGGIGLRETMSHVWPCVI